MKKEIKSALKKTVKIACVTCVAAGAVAVVTSGAALKAIEEGGKYLADRVKKIVKETDQHGEVTEGAASEEAFAETAI